MERIVLASRSPRRKQLLEWAEIPFDVIVTDTDELYPADFTAARNRSGQHFTPVAIGA